MVETIERIYKISVFYAVDNDGEFSELTKGLRYMAGSTATEFPEAFLTPYLCGPESMDECEIADMESIDYFLLLLGSRGLSEECLQHVLVRANYATDKQIPVLLVAPKVVSKPTHKVFWKYLTHQVPRVLVYRYKSEAEVWGLISVHLKNLMNRYPAGGWVRAGEIVSA